MENFTNLKLNKQLLEAITELQYEKPTPIQEKAIPLILAGHDLMGIAQTGTGKTAAFTLPILMKVKYAQGQHPRALILAPTKELAIQIGLEVEKFSKYTDLRILTIYGGIGPKTQIETIEKGIDILVATPGRLIDIYKREKLTLKDIKTLVLDEADKMMDMGFMGQINQVLELIPAKKRQNLLFSATMPEKVQKLSEDFLEFPEKVEIAPQATTAENVTQYYYKIPNLKTKINLLKYFLDDVDTFSKVLIFANTKKSADAVYKFIARKLSEEEVRVIHANKSQNTRINSMEAFKNDDIRILVATDIAARGIDATKVSHVINFDVPTIYEEYVHRIGRTGRAENTGIALSFANEGEIYHLKKIEELIQQEIPLKDIPEEVEVTETPFEEAQKIARAIDYQKRKENPDFKGAFHDKKKKKNKFKQPKKNKN